MPEGYVMPYKLEELGVSKDDSSFVAIVHIDGNGMGKRVENLRTKCKDLSWEEYKKTLRSFSDAIDADFKTAFRGMLDEDRRADSGSGGCRIEPEEPFFPG